MSESMPIPEMEFVYETNGIYAAHINYQGRTWRAELAAHSLRYSRANVIAGCFNLEIPPDIIAVYMERVYRWYLDHGGEKTR